MRNFRLWAHLKVDQIQISKMAANRWIGRFMQLWAYMELIEQENKTCLEDFFTSQGCLLNFYNTFQIDKCEPFE